MLDNCQMNANRFGKWAHSRRMIATIQNALLANRAVTVSTHLRATRFNKPTHATMFKATKSGAYMQRGKHWDCIDYCSITIE